MRRTWRWTITIGLVMWVSLAQAQAPDSASRPAWEEFWATTVQGRLKVRVYPSSRPSTHPALIIVLHGDSPFAPPSYQYRFARQAAAQSDGAVVAAILRPGYTDGESQSDGTRGTTNGDNYTPEVVDAVNQAITQLRDKYKPRHVVVVGHSGGAAIGADLLGRHPEAADVALLVACPCDVTAWRRHMKVLQGSSILGRARFELVSHGPGSNRLPIDAGVDGSRSGGPHRATCFYERIRRCASQSRSES
jgi:alpha-beta hydrolase superfamily lysophospholipase